MYIPINQWAEDDRPREKFLLKGKAALSDSELLAILIGSGSRNESAVQLCQRILASANNNLNQLGKLSVKHLMEYKGIGEAKAISIAQRENIELKQGVYVAGTGPTFETKAEYHLIKAIGGDVVGMSTVQENIVAVHGGMKVFAMSIVTDLGIREEDNVITHEEVLQAAKEAEPKFTLIFKELIKEI